jgi:hypothetical protein
MTRDEILDWVQRELNQVTKETSISTRKKHGIHEARYCFGFHDGYVAALQNILDLVEEQHAESH